MLSHITATPEGWTLDPDIAGRIGIALLIGGAAITALLAGSKRKPTGSAQLNLITGFLILVFLVGWALPFWIAGYFKWSAVVPLFPPGGADFRDGLYLPAQAFTTLNSKYPPLTLIVGLPFTLLPLRLAYFVDIGVLVALAAGACWLCADIALQGIESREKGTSPRTVLGLASVMGLWLFTSYPFAFSIERGNLDIYALFFSSLGVWLLVRRPDALWLVMLPMAIAASLKLYPAVLWVLLVWRHRWRAIPPIVGTMTGFWFVAGVQNAKTSLGGLLALQGKPMIWIGNHSAACFANLVHNHFSVLPINFLKQALVLTSLALAGFTVALVIRRGWNPQGVPLVAAACVPPMCVVPATSHDYKLVMLLLPFTVITALLVADERKDQAPWRGLFGLHALSFAFVSLSTLVVAAAISPQGLANKLPWVFLIQVLILAIVLRSRPGFPGTAESPPS